MTPRHALHVALAMSAALVQLPALAQAATDTPPPARGYFTCKDGAGHTLTSDRFITECSDREQREYSPGGALRRVITPPLNAEQRRQKDIDDKKKADAELAANERRRLDRVLLQTYASTDAIDAARERALVEPRSGIDKSKQRLNDLKREREQLKGETEFYKNRALPVDLDSRIKDNETATQYEQDLVGRRNAEIDRISDRYATDKARWVQLTTERPTSN